MRQNTGEHRNRLGDDGSGEPIGNYGAREGRDSRGSAAGSARRAMRIALIRALIVMVISQETVMAVAGSAMVVR